MPLLARVWLAVGWAGITLLLYLSLTPRMPFEIPVKHGDKYGHSLAYAVLAFWWTQLPLPRHRVAFALVALGVAIEFVQGWTGRSFDYFDMLANIQGVASGVGVAAVLPNPLLFLERRFKKDD
ncbi:Aste57867_8970 [Aphanomyces stellatus]|uniref:Aste57867_8970 protein n=1 Tax=Aphanomyces stellatus TaxID=120398 RepID=A0A485KM01_9STRA|nr:hypothetical protein As57867_008935 [Aphanomyces stellatus]VFT85854.1 Aste57867_8970 [Aphanomyces stellatus]